MDKKDTNRGRDIPKGPALINDAPFSKPDPERISVLAQSKAMKALEPYIRNADENTLLETTVVPTNDREAQKRNAKIGKLVENALRAGVERSKIPASLLKQASR